MLTRHKPFTHQRLLGHDAENEAGNDEEIEMQPRGRSKSIFQVRNYNKVVCKT